MNNADDCIKNGLVSDANEADASGERRGAGVMKLAKEEDNLQQADDRDDDRNEKIGIRSMAPLRGPSTKRNEKLGI